MMPLFLLHVFLLVFLQGPPLPETIRAAFNASTVAPLVGQPVRLILTVELPPGAEIIRWPAIADAWGPFMVRSVGDVETGVSGGGRLTLTQQFTVILWQPGDHETPETFIDYRLSGIEEIYSVPVTPFRFRVPSVVDETDLTLRPFKPQVSLFFIPWWIIGVATLILAVSVWAAWGRYQRWQQSHRQRSAAVIVPDALDLVVQHLTRLKSDRVSEHTAADAVSQGLRTFIGARLKGEVTGMSTPELMRWLVAQRILNSARLEELGRLLEYCDSVKFAGSTSAQTGASKLLSLALRWVQVVEETAKVAEETPDST